MANSHRSLPQNVRNRVSTSAQRVSNAILSGLLWLGTLPYYRFFYFNTLGAIKRIALYTTTPSDFPVLVCMLRRWRERKLAEAQFISIACAVVAGAVIGSFSWNNIKDAFWLASASWYCSLVLSILGMLLSAQQIAVFNILGDIPSKSDSPIAQSVVDRYKPLLVYQAEESGLEAKARSLALSTTTSKPRPVMVFAWQCPMMFMSYSVCFFLIGLTLFVTTPLIRLKEHGWDTDANVAVFYLVTATIAGSAFVLCSFWIYHYLDFEADLLTEQDKHDFQEPLQSSRMSSTQSQTFQAAVQ